MFGRKSGGTAETGPQTATASEPAPDAPAAAPGHCHTTLSTPCACGHERSHHTGLRLDVNGRCLECDCAEFAGPEPVPQAAAAAAQTLAAALDQVEELRSALAQLRAQLGGEPLGDAQPDGHAQSPVPRTAVPAPHEHRALGVRRPKARSRGD